MKATVMTNFGSQDVFKVKNISQPIPGSGEVLVKVSATSVNLIDCRHRQYGYLRGMKLPAVIGCEVSGVIAATGSNVSQFAVGDEVFYSTNTLRSQGTYAEYHITQESMLVKKPTGLSHIDAVGLPVNGSLLWEALIVQGGLSKGETLLIRDGIDCLGMIAIQVAKIAGARIVILCSKHQMDTAKGLGADIILERQSKNIHQQIAKATCHTGVDVFLDTIGGAEVSNYIPHIKQSGRMLGVINMQIDLAAAAEKDIFSKLVRHESDQAKLKAIYKLIEQGRIKTVVDTVMPLSEVGLAHQRMERGAMCGKIILVPNG